MHLIPGSGVPNGDLPLASDCRDPDDSMNRCVRSRVPQRQRAAAHHLPAAAAADGAVRRQSALLPTPQPWWTTRCHRRSRRSSAITSASTPATAATEQVNTPFLTSACGPGMPAPLSPF
jgi:hypothetical protein